MLMRSAVALKGAAMQRFWVFMSEWRNWQTR